jgi:hypothetical protein
VQTAALTARRPYRCALVVLFALSLAPVIARAQMAGPGMAQPPPPPPAPAAPLPATGPTQPVTPLPPATPPPATNTALPGSPAPPGLALSPEAPPVPPAPGGRAPSYGAPHPDKPTAFRIGGRFYGWQAIGIGSTPDPQPQGGFSGTPLHIPMRSTGKIPFWGGSGATLNLSYGSRYVTAYTSYYFRVSREEQFGYANPQLGPAFGIAYLLITPDPIGTLRLNFKIGAFTEPYAGPGQWGWGIFGPMLAVRGYGETTTGEWDINRSARFVFNHGVLVVPGVSANFPRGDYNSWIERGVSTWVHHAHAGVVFDNQYTLKLHYASARGTDERSPTTMTFIPPTPPGDGRFDVYLGEARWQAVPWGQLGVSGGVYDFRYAVAVGDGIWWAVDWTQGSREMTNKFLGPRSQATGKVAVVGFEYNFSVASILWAKARNPPRSFTGQAPDLRVAIAGMLTRTIATRDPAYQDAMGYFFGLDTEYRMTSMFSLTFQAYGERRDSPLGPWSVYSVNPGISLRTDWLSTDRIQLIYGRRFYSHVADPNTAQPFDRHMIALGGYITF